ncbi:MAG: hypothetical protein COA47_08345 [Robiginitomaculum sp.]|nr:MAG: hypothetical protein COA47_08345 [Robiginitomaculum sp.]
MMTQEPTQKFNFDTEFDANGNIIANADSWRKTVSHDEVEKQVAAAFDRGKEDELVKVEETTNAQLKEIGAQLREILSTTQAITDKCQQDAVDLTIVIARKIAGVALDKFEFDQVENVVRKTLKGLRGNPRITLRVPQGLAEKLESEIEGISDDVEFSGSVRVEGEADLVAGSVVLEWCDGEIRSDPEEIANRIETEITNWSVSTGSVSPPAPETKNITQGDSNV